MEQHSTASFPACLCLGPKSSGKTQLLSSLQSSGATTNIHVVHAVPTIGTNIFTVKLSDSSTQKQPNASSASTATTSNTGKAKAGNANIRRSMKNPTVTVMEIGGSMAPMWSNYLNNVSKILYVIDTSNLCQISAAGVLLYSLLADPRLQHTKFLLILTKMDLAYRQMRNEALLMLQFDKLKKQIRQTIQIVETSSITCNGHQQIIDWLALP